jgi:7-cyano-7-deazaguanine synthase
MSHSDHAHAVVLLSGGLDSTTCLALAKSQGRTCSCLTIEYGQRHDAELRSARRVAEAIGVHEHRFVRVDLGSFGGSALTSDIPVPKDEASTGIPVTYVPARNTVFLSLALALAEVLEAQEIWIGVNAVDYSGYPDCRPEFIAAFEQMAALATKVGVEEGRAPRIVTPLIDMSKAEIIHCGLEVGVDYSLTVTCYDPDVEGRACGHCEACTLRQKGFDEAGIADPTTYR